MSIRVYHGYDLVLKFDSDFLRSAFIKAFEKFISEITTSGDACLAQMMTNITHAMLLKQAITKKHRQKKLEMFFRVVFAQVYTSVFFLIKYLHNVQLSRPVIYIHEMFLGIPYRTYRRRNPTNRFDSGTRSNSHRVDHHRICRSLEYETGRRVRKKSNICAK